MSQAKQRRSARNSVEKSCISVLLARCSTDEPTTHQNKVSGESFNFQQKRPFIRALDLATEEQKIRGRKNISDAESDKLLSKIQYLCEKITSLEERVDNQSTIIDSLKNTVNQARPQCTNAESQTDAVAYRSYAAVCSTETDRAAALGVETNKAAALRVDTNSQNREQEIDLGRKSEEISRGKRDKEKNPTVAKKSDVRMNSDDDKSNDVKHSSNANGNKKGRQKSSKTEGLPKVLILSDSVITKVNANRLGNSYGFHAEKQKASTMKDVLPALGRDSTKSPKDLDAVVIHCGVNDIKNTSPAECSKKLAKTVRTIREKRPGLKIVVSKIVPVADPRMNYNGELLNALLVSELNNEENVSFVSNYNLQTNRYNLYDGIHPTDRGTSILAKNIGRHVRDLFWERPQRTARHPRYLRSTPFHGDPLFSAPWYNRFDILNEI